MLIDYELDDQLDGVSLIKPSLVHQSFAPVATCTG